MIKDDEDHDEDCSIFWKFSFAIKGINYILKNIKIYKKRNF